MSGLCTGNVPYRIAMQAEAVPNRRCNEANIALCIGNIFTSNVFGNLIACAVPHYRYSGKRSINCNSS